VLMSCVAKTVLVMESVSMMNVGVTQITKVKIVKRKSVRTTAVVEVDVTTQNFRSPMIHGFQKVANV